MKPSSGAPAIVVHQIYSASRRRLHPPPDAARSPTETASRRVGLIAGLRATNQRVFSSSMPINAEGLGDRICRFTFGGTQGDFLAQLEPELGPSDLYALCPGSGHAGSGPFADLQRLDIS